MARMDWLLLKEIMGQAVLLHGLEGVAWTALQAMGVAAAVVAEGGPRIATLTAAVAVAVEEEVVAARALRVDNRAAALLLFIFSPRMHKLHFARSSQATAAMAETVVMAVREEFMGLAETAGLTVVVANRTMGEMALVVATAAMEVAAGTAAAARAALRLELRIREVQPRSLHR